MTENEHFNRRLEAVEADIKILYKKVNEVVLEQVTNSTKLDSMLVTLGELKESIEALKKRPSWLWDKVIVAVIGSVVGIVVSLLVE